MANPRDNNIGAYIKPVVNVLAPAAAAEVDGAAIQTDGPGYGYLSCTLTLAVGAVAGAPTSFSAVATLEDSPDGATGWAPIADAPAVTPAVVAANTQATANIGLRANRGFIRAAVVPTFVGGTSPSLDVAAVIVLGGGDELPAI